MRNELTKLAESVKDEKQKRVKQPTATASAE